MEIYRPTLGKPLLQNDDPHIIAVASDQNIENLSVPVFDLNNIVGIADFIIKKVN
jgi:hypothetical protein